MLDIKYDGTHVNFVTADDVLDVKEFQKKNFKHSSILQRWELKTKTYLISFQIL